MLFTPFFRSRILRPISVFLLSSSCAVFFFTKSSFNDDVIGLHRYYSSHCANNNFEILKFSTIETHFNRSETDGLKIWREKREKNAYFGFRYVFIFRVGKYDSSRIYILWNGKIHSIEWRMFMRLRCSVDLSKCSMWICSCWLVIFFFNVLCALLIRMAKQLLY